MENAPASPSAGDTRLDELVAKCRSMEQTMRLEGNAPAFAAIADKWKGWADAIAELRRRVDIAEHESDSDLRTCTKLSAALATATAAEQKAREALLHLQSYGCPLCNGDCAGANPPVMNCPMRMAVDALASPIGGIDANLV